MIPVPNGDGTGWHLERDKPDPVKAVVEWARLLVAEDLPCTVTAPCRVCALREALRALDAAKCETCGGTGMVTELNATGGCMYICPTCGGGR